MQQKCKQLCIEVNEGGWDAWCEPTTSLSSKTFEQSFTESTFSCPPSLCLLTAWDLNCFHYYCFSRYVNIERRRPPPTSPRLLPHGVIWLFSQNMKLFQPPKSTLTKQVHTVWRWKNTNAPAVTMGRLNGWANVATCEWRRDSPVCLKGIHSIFCKDPNALMMAAADVTPWYRW